jgi:hypothetical protein
MIHGEIHGSLLETPLRSRIESAKIHGFLGDKI